MNEYISAKFTSIVNAVRPEKTTEEIHEEMSHEYYAYFPSIGDIMQALEAMMEVKIARLIQSYLEAGIHNTSKECVETAICMYIAECERFNVCMPVDWDAYKKVIDALTPEQKRNMVEILVSADYPLWVSQFSEDQNTGKTNIRFNI